MATRSPALTKFTEHGATAAELRERDATIDGARAHLAAAAKEAADAFGVAA